MVQLGLGAKTLTDVLENSVVVLGIGGGGRGGGGQQQIMAFIASRINTRSVELLRWSIQIQI